MARDPKQLRKAYEIKIGKDRADKLSDDQIGLLSKFYNQLSESEQSDIDSGILMGYNNTPLHQMAEEFISEKEDTPEDNSVSVATAIDEDDDDNFEPLGLEELLGDIREEGKKENALAIYEGTREDDLVDEEIDERILKLIGLNEVFDIDYSTYLTLLKEKMVAARMTDSKLSTEESELLTNEFKRVKGKVGRFVIKKKKVNIGNAPENQAIKANKLLPPSSLTPPEASKDKDTFKKEKKTEKVSKDSQYLLDITKTLKSIKDILTKQSKLNENIKNSERKRLEKERRSGREEDREKKNKGGNFLGNIKKVAPSLGIFDTIVRFITNVLLGKTILGLMDWMSDPANKKKLEAIGNFLKDWWPALTAAFLFFATPLGGFVRLMVKTLGGLTKFLLKNSLKLLKFAGKNPIAAAAIAIIGGAAIGGIMQSVTPSNDPERAKEGKTQLEDTQDFGGTTGAPISGDMLGFAAGGLVQAYSKGGLVQGLSDNIVNLSQKTNKVTYASGGGLVGGDTNNITYASGGGLINPKIVKNIIHASGGGIIGGNNNYFSSSPKITYASGGGLINSRNANNITYASGGGLVGGNINNITYASGGGLINSRNANNITYASGGGLIGNYFNSSPKITYASGGGLINSRNTNNINYASGGGLINSKNINNTNSTNSTSNTTYASGGGFIGGDTNNTTTYASSPKITYASGGGSISRNINAINYFSGGGPSLGTDTVPAMLTPGEFVMSKGAVNKFGANTMMAMNKAGGGTNKPKVISGTSFASGGGLIGGNNNYFNSSPKITYASGGGLVDALSFLPGTGTVMAPRASGTGQYADQGTTVQKFLGMPIPGSMKRSKYTSEDIQRYNRLDTGDPSRYLESYDAQDSRSESINKIYSKYGRTPTSPAVRSKKREVSDTPTPGTSQKERNGRSNSMSDFGKSITNIGPNIETIIRRKNEIDKQIEFLSTGKTKAYSGGGVVSLSNNINYFSGGGLSRGTDTVPAMLTPGEFVMSKGAVNKFGTSTMMSMNKAGGGTNKPKVISGTSFASGGGFVNSQPKGPKISDADFATLLAITALEDTDAQGRADVAQSLYNRLYSVNTYGSNYNQSNNTLKSIITAKSEGGRKGGGQYEPTFGNPQDWKNITDMKSAASAVVNSEKGRKYGYTMETAMQQILDTKKAISNPDLQKKAREHVQGRTYFLGKSEQKYMEPGDVLRDPDRNFFSMWYDEDKIYGKERANIASPMPQRLIPPPSPIIPKSSETKVTPQKAGPKGLIESLTDEQGMSGFYMKPINAIFGNRSSNDLSIDKNVRPIIPEPPPSKSMKNGTINLPPIDLGGGGRSPYQEAIPSVQGSQEPKFPAISQMSRNIRKKKLDTYGVIL